MRRKEEKKLKNVTSVFKKFEESESDSHSDEHVRNKDKKVTIKLDDSVEMMSVPKSLIESIFLRISTLEELHTTSETNFEKYYANLHSEMQAKEKINKELTNEISRLKDELRNCKKSLNQLKKELITESTFNKTSIDNMINENLTIVGSEKENVSPLLSNTRVKGKFEEHYSGYSPRLRVVKTPPKLEFPSLKLNSFVNNASNNASFLQDKDYTTLKINHDHPMEEPMGLFSRRRDASRSKSRKKAKSYSTSLKSRMFLVK